MEHFYTIQGEGYHQGKAAYFIRLGGCDVGCVWCDVKDSWDVEKHPKLNVERLKLNVLETPAKLVVITGGEPLMHNLDELTTALHPNCKLYLQPEWDKATEVTPLLIAYIKANPKWQLSLQVHKYINVP